MNTSKDNQQAKEHLAAHETSLHSGLAASEIDERLFNEQSNAIQEKTQRTIRDILKTNLVTFFNILNLVLFLLVLTTGHPQNGFFAVIIVANILIGTIQELRAKKTMDALSLLNKAKVQILREGKLTEQSVDNVLLDDIIHLNTGDQVPADCIIRKGEGLEVDESLLTGESLPIEKSDGEILYSGSFILAGACQVQAYRVGKDTYINQLAKEAKQFKKKTSVLQENIYTIIKRLSFIIIPIGICLFISQYFRAGLDFNTLLLTTVAAMIGMIPEGLVLLTSIAFALGIIRLGRFKTLVQELPAIESLARVDTLCLDKTGTLTEGELVVIKEIPLGKETSFSQRLATFIYSMEGNNDTSKALKKYYSKEPLLPLEVQSITPFSSRRKWSAITFTTGDTYYLGAPEFLLKEIEDESIAFYSKQGYRVLAFGMTSETTKEKELPEVVTPVGLILLEDKIRDNAKETLKYFQEQGVTLKLISGDSPLTVASIAKRLGMHQLGDPVDASTIKDNEKLDTLIEEATIFGRVSPDQKREMVEALRRNGHTVAMTGDGVNDILALKSADCSIAMASGSEASRAVAQVVLLDSNFNSMPRILLEGRRVINNIQRVASLFLVKTVYSVILAIFVTLLGFSYPFMPIQITLISSLAVGFPSFLLALEPNQEKVSGNFFRKIFSIAIPGGIIISFSLLSINFITKILDMNLPFSQLSTMLVLATGLTQMFILYRVCRPLNLWRSALVVLMTGAFIGAFFIPFTRDFFLLAPLNIPIVLYGVGFALFSAILFFLGEKLLKKFLKKKA